MISAHRVSYVLLMTFAVFAGIVNAQDISAPIEDEVRQRLRVNTHISPLGENAFGENVNLYNGTLSFEQTDVDLKGIGPDITLTRSYSVADTAAPWWREFVDWRMEIPHIETLTTPSEASFFISPATGRCSGIASNGALPITMPNEGGGPPIELDPIAWWYGYHLDMPGSGQEDLIIPGAQNTRTLPKVTLSGGQVVQASIITRSNFAIACLPATSNGAGGEGFLAIAPDGTQYYLDRLIYKPANEYGTAPYQIQRNLAMMMVSRVVDRFGNTLTYNYDANNNLTSIVASDGRSLSLSYTNYTIQPTLEISNPGPGYRVATATVTAGNGTARTWNYGYETGASSYGDLSSVTLPDGSGWSFSLDNFREYEDVPDLDMVNYNPGGVNCQYVTEPQNAKTFVGAMTHPSGLTGTFIAKNTIRGESYVPYLCVPSANTEYLQYRNVMAYTSLIQKQYSGAGLPGNEVWTYGYSGPNQSWTTDGCASSNSCATSVYTDVVDPSGNDVRYTYSNRFDASESQLQDTSSYQGAAGSTLLQDIRTSYAAANAGSWPSSLGTSLGGELNTVLVTSLTPLNQKQFLQNGDTYTWQAVAFDSYANPTDTKRFNSIIAQPSIEELHSYLYDTGLWVMGLPVSTTNAATSEVESGYIYNANDLVASRSRFGELLMSYTYDSTGNLSTFTDGNGHKTTFGNYYRGIPQSISYPDSTAESLVVDDFGQITSITDQAGYTTQYSYDPVGRIAQITYPYNSNTDNIHWNAKTFTYTYVANAERGIAGGHWDRVVSLGTDTDTTYFDAMLNPALDDNAIIGTANSDITTATAYDWRGKNTFTSYAVSGAPALSAITSGKHTTYDALERVSQTQQDSELGTLTTSITYVAGSGTQVTDPKGNVATRYFQAFDQPSYEAVKQVNAADGITQTIARDVYGNPTAITQSGAYGAENDSVTKTLMYDSYHRLCRSTEPETGSKVFSYDQADNVQWSAEGQSITDGTCGLTDVASTAQTIRTYDPMNRVLTITPPTGTQSTTYTYEPRGLLASARSGISYWWAYYNTRKQIYTESLWLDGQSAWGYGYLYDPNDHLGALIYPNLEGVAFSPDARGWPTQVGTYASAITYFPDGGVQAFTLGNGITQLTQRNARQLPSSRSYNLGASPLLSEGYSYDGDANLTQIKDGVNGANNQTLGYDALNRLTSASAPNAWGTQTYAYDALNNLRQFVTGGYPFNLNIDANNRLASMTVGTTPFATYQNNAAGDRVAVTYQGATTNYTFDAEDQLLAIPGVESYAYDDAGRRVAKTPNGGNALYSFYTGAGDLVYTYNAGTSQGTNYIYLDGQLIARNQAGTPTYLLTDRLGSVVRETTASGAVSATLAYQPYGSLYNSPSENQPGYTGHEHDAETSFVYMQARYYEPSTHFLSPDPVDPEPGNVYNFNRYAYASNNPTSNIDPDGEEPCDKDNQTNPSDPGCSGKGDQPPPAPATTDLAQAPAVQINRQPSQQSSTAKTLASVAVTATRVPWRAISWRSLISVLPESVAAYVAVPILWAVPTDLSAPACEMPGAPACGTMVFSKGGKQNIRDTGLVDVPDAEIKRRLKDRTTSGEEKKRLQKEQKSRKIRNIGKRQQ